MTHYGQALKVSYRELHELVFAALIPSKKNDRKNNLQHRNLEQQITILTLKREWKG